MKTLLLLSTSVVALIASNTIAAQHPTVIGPRAGAHPFQLPPAHLLYSQNSNFGSAIQSMNFTDGSYSSLYDTAAADDFVIPAGRSWTITKVDAPGLFYNGSGPATSVVVTFYADAKGKPGNVKASYTLDCTDTTGTGTFACDIPGPHGNGLRLRGATAGKRYWLSVTPNMAFIDGSGQWAWVQNTNTHRDPGQWENPGNGFGTGCKTWNNTSTCIPSAVDDFAFDLRGTKQ